jgi:hypothetical protein
MPGSGKRDKTGCSWHYVGGAWSALLPADLGWYTFIRLRHETKQATRAGV